LPDEEIVQDSETKVEYELYTYRFVQLALYCLALMMNMVAWMSLQTCADALVTGFNIHDKEIAFMGQLFVIVFIPANFPSTWILDHYGLRTGILCGCILTVVGMWLKLLMLQNYYLVWIGQAIAGMG
jgi:fucose permease